MSKPITLPWFVAALSPNGRAHWLTRSKAAKTARKQAWAATLEAGWRMSSFRGYEGRTGLDMAFYYKTSRPVDLDNCLAGMKAAIDGIADALGVNDSRFVFSLRRMDETGGKIVVTISKQ